MTEIRAQRLAAFVLVLAGLAATAAAMVWPDAFGPSDSPSGNCTAAGPLAVAIGAGVIFHLRPTAKARAARRRR